MSRDLISWLTDWYSGHCDGRWEHDYGVKIDTLDNPGWSIVIDLTGTGLEIVPFDEQSFNLDDDAAWWVCKRENNAFVAFCGATQLSDVLGVFRDWAEANARSADVKKPSAT